MSTNSAGDRSERSREVWTKVKSALETPAGRQRVRELIRSGLGVEALVFPSVRIAQAVLPLVEGLVKALGFALVPDSEPPAQTSAWALSDDDFAAKAAVNQIP